MSHKFILYTGGIEAPENPIQYSQELFEKSKTRRSVREFDSKTVEKGVIENLIKIAGTAPSGANKQPWTFCAISDPNLKKQIRVAAEKEEKESYENRMSEEWLADLAHLGTNWEKPFLTDAPWLIVIFRKAYDVLSNNKKGNTYYSIESTGIAAGFMIRAIHDLGLVTLTHTPSPMNFLTQILNRPANERPFLLLPVGYPKNGATVPDIHRKPLSEISTFY